MPRLHVVPDRPARITVPHDVVVHHGKVLFGAKQDDSGIIAIILPWFNIQGYQSKGIINLVTQINANPRLHQSNLCERLLEKSLGEMDSRISIENGNLVAYDQDAATLLWRMQVPLSKERHFFLIR